jgi:Fe-S cluster biogenesis protein NfuA
LKEIMAPETALQKQIQRIATIVERLESTSDPSLRAWAKELLESLMALHGAGLERILELASRAGEVGNAIIRDCGRDELVSSLLLLYGLHPDDLRTRVTRAIEKSHSYLEPHGASAELISVREDGSVLVRLHVKSSGCGSSATTVKATLEAAIQDAVPDATAVMVEQAGAQARSGFVSLAQLQSGQALSASVVPRAQRSGG